jgi:hypothetical protein
MVEATEEGRMDVEDISIGANSDLDDIGESRSGVRGLDVTVEVWMLAVFQNSLSRPQCHSCVEPPAFPAKHLPWHSS